MRRASAGPGQGCARATRLALAVVLLGCAACAHLEPAPVEGAAPLPSPKQPQATAAAVPASAAAGDQGVAAPEGSALAEDELDFALDAELEAEMDLAIADPWQPFNRRVFAFNRALDRWLLDPLGRAYSALLPDPAEKAVRRLFENLDQPAVVVNDVLQLEGRRAGRATARFLVNSTLGLAGLFDPAARMRLPARDADFGQTLGKAGMRPGPFLVAPLLGPSDPRDLLGTIVDGLLHPEAWLLPLRIQLPIESVDAVSEKESHREELDELERASVDYYAALRSGYLMMRRQRVKDASQPATGDVSPPSSPPPASP